VAEKKIGDLHIINLRLGLEFFEIYLTLSSDGFDKIFSDA
jgi:hypothetical protein